MGDLYYYFLTLSSSSTAGQSKLAWVRAIVPIVSPQHLRYGKHEGVMEDDAQGSSQKVRTKLSRQRPEQEKARALLLLQLPQKLCLVWESAA